MNGSFYEANRHGMNQTVRHDSDALWENRPEGRSIFPNIPVRSPSKGGIISMVVPSKEGPVTIEPS